MKAQSTIEYLTVYGWALVALLVVLSVLYLAGILKFQSPLTRECVFQPGIECTDFKLLSPNNVRLTVKNKFGFKIRVFTPFPSNIKAVSSTGVRSVSSSISPSTVDPEGAATVSFTFSSNTVNPVGAYQKYYINITYTNCETTTNPNCIGGSQHLISGRAYSVVEQA